MLELEFPPFHGRLSAEAFSADNLLHVPHDRPTAFYNKTGKYEERDLISVSSSFSLGLTPLSKN